MSPDQFLPASAASRLFPLKSPAICRPFHTEAHLPPSIRRFSAAEATLRIPALPAAVQSGSLVPLLLRLPPQCRCTECPGHDIRKHAKLFQFLCCTGTNCGNFYMGKKYIAYIHFQHSDLFPERLYPDGAGKHKPLLAFLFSDTPQNCPKYFIRPDRLCCNRRQLNYLCPQFPKPSGQPGTVLPRAGGQNLFSPQRRFFTQSNFSDNVQTFPTRMIAGVCT